MNHLSRMYTRALIVKASICISPGLLNNMQLHIMKKLGKFTFFLQSFYVSFERHLPKVTSLSTFFFNEYQIEI